ncbi:MAG: DUF1453 family protein [Candidatus Eremiobacteraeota bacterium]|nr:DUF1453 family protein [Candidatus Eremiobacteraeota bacterium]
MQHTQPPISTTLIVYGLALAFLVWRFSRPQTIGVWRLWFMPVLLTAITAYNIYITPALAALEGTVPPPAWETVVAIAIGIVAGIPLGIVRGRHSDVTLGRRRNTIQIRSSMIVLFIWLGAFIVKAALRYVAGASSLALALGDGLLVFAVAALVTSYIMIWQKYQALTQSQNAQAVTSAS